VIVLSVRCAKETLDSWDRARTALDDAYQESQRQQPPGNRC
jgi:hypothetical protein